jgi:hypothetical protein
MLAGTRKNAKKTERNMENDLKKAGTGCILIDFYTALKSRAARSANKA